MIDKNELLKLLPKLIREDDEIKGAIITALSGVVATKDDIARIIENSNRRFEAMDKRFEAMDKRFEAMDKRFETLIVQMNKGFEEARKHRENIENTLIIVRESIGELIQNVTTKEDIERANKEILDYLKQQYEN
ncbi:hypothetical protein LCGC14_1725190 [marine sediment metagenome]|uniref:Uncharacterized protein n=1 Tax=marine sediment metagenome TaxID=412755 RepID=A0A0F9HBB4_9ZZZZ|nr:hypothetical protein [archaeon]